jgi:hypothetical protein
MEQLDKTKSQVTSYLDDLENLKGTVKKRDGEIEELDKKFISVRDSKLDVEA